MKTKKLFILAALFQITSFIFAHPDGKQHDNDLCLVLFGKSEKNTMNSNSGLDSKKIEQLEAACYLSIDYFKSTNTTDKGNKALILLNLNDKYTLEDVKVGPDGPNGHEKYTHLGWNEKFYSGKSKKLIDGWIFRRDKILVDSVEKILKDSNPTKEQVILFSMLCYYIHILGDHEENKPGTATDRMMFSQRKNSKQQECVLDELIYITKHLFVDDDTGPLIRTLEEIKKASRNIDDRTEKGMTRIHKYSEQTLNVLQNYIPEYVRNCDILYFSFYLDEMELAA